MACFEGSPGVGSLQEGSQERGGHLCQVQNQEHHQTEEGKEAHHLLHLRLALQVRKEPLHVQQDEKHQGQTLSRSAGHRVYSFRDECWDLQAAQIRPKGIRYAHRGQW